MIIPSRSLGHSAVTLAPRPDWKPGFIGGIVGGVFGYLILLYFVRVCRLSSIWEFFASFAEPTTRVGPVLESQSEPPLELNSDGSEEVHSLPSETKFTTHNEPVEPLPGLNLEGSEEVKVYKLLLEYLMNRLSGIEDESQMLVTRLQERVAYVAQLDVIGSLVESHQYRMDLLAILDELNSKEYSESPYYYAGNFRESYKLRRRHNKNAAIRDALHADEAHLSDLLGDILASDDEMQRALHLPVEDAERFMNLIQFVLDNRWWGRLDFDPAILLEARRFLVKLSKACDILPSSLSLQGVELLGVHPASGGGFADIFKGYYAGKTVALKRLRVFEDQVHEERLSIHRKFCHEALMWQQLEHPNLLPFLGVDTETFSPHLCIVLPWMWNGTILKHIQNNGTSNLLTHVYEIAQAVEYLHSQGIIHGDLRGANILIDEGWRACLTDFGLASFAETNTVTYTTGQAGATRWMAPELHLPQSFGLERYQRTRATDVYSFACVCIEIYTGKHPFAYEAKDTQVMIEVVKGARPERPSGRSCVRAMPDDLWELVQKCWAQQFQDRPDMPYIVQLLLRMLPASVAADVIENGSRERIRGRGWPITRSSSRFTRTSRSRSRSRSTGADRRPSQSFSRGHSRSTSRRPSPSSSRRPSPSSSRRPGPPVSRSPSRYSSRGSSRASSSSHRSTQESALEQTTSSRPPVLSSTPIQENLPPIQTQSLCT